MVDKDMYKMYTDIRDSGLLPKNDLFGNGQQTIRYTANGEATDWMASQNVLAVSPELGTRDHRTDKFFPHQHFIHPIVHDNFPWINYTMYKLTSQVEVKISSYSRQSSTDKSHEYFDIQIEVSNYGFAEAKDIVVYLEAKSPFELVSVEGKDSSSTEINNLSTKNLKSLESKSWNITGRITKSDWNVLKDQDFTKSKDKLLKISTDKYPHISNLQKSTRALSAIDIISAEVIHDSGEDKWHNSKFAYYVVAVLIIVIIALGIGYRCLKKKATNPMVRLDDEYDNRIGKAWSY